MGKEILDAHPSVVVIYSSDAEKFFLSGYDGGYPRRAYQNSANNFGGNPEPFDIIIDPTNPREGSCSSPSKLLIRELYEELDPEAQGPNHDKPNKFGQRVDWASPEDITMIRDSIVSNLKSYQDFMVRQPEVIEGANDPYQGIYSAFYADIPGEVMELAERAKRDRKTLVTEGLQEFILLRD